MKPRRVHRRTLLEAPYESVCEALLCPAVMQHIARPLMIIRSADPEGFPARWEPRRYRAKLFGLGFLPLGWQDIDVGFAEIEPGRLYRGRDRGGGQLARQWDHRLEAERIDDRHSAYSDTVDIDAAALTPIAEATVGLLFAHRQRRLRKLARNGFRL